VFFRNVCVTSLPGIRAKQWNLTTYFFFKYGLAFKEFIAGPKNVITPWSGAHIEELVVAELFRNSPFYIEPGGSLPSSQKPVTRPLASWILCTLPVAKCCSMYCLCRLCCSVYCLSINVYCTAVTGCQPICTVHIYHISYILAYIISYISYQVSRTVLWPSVRRSYQPFFSVTMLDTPNMSLQFERLPIGGRNRIALRSGQAVSVAPTQINQRCQLCRSLSLRCANAVTA